MAASTLLKGGTALIHNANDHVVALKQDILIRGNQIVRLAPSIAGSEADKVLDCTDKIITPGFVDTHHHLWQTQMRGLHGNQTLLEYLPLGISGPSYYNPDDVFWGQLAGSLEALDGGITTIVDHSHVNYSPEHVYAALRATVASGVRSIYGYCPTARIESLQPFQMNRDLLPPWVMDTFDKLAAAKPFGDGRVLLGFAFDGFFLPKEMLDPLFHRVVEGGIQLFTTHDGVGPMALGHSSKLTTMKQLGLLSPNLRTILSHANNIPSSSAPELAANNVAISNTPSSELQMGMGKPGDPVPVAFTDPALSPHTSIGIDCHTIGSGFVPSQLRELLAAARIYRHDQDYQHGKWHRSLATSKPGEGFPSVEQAFNVATIGGARAVGLADKIGRIKEGYNADLVIWDALSPNMVAGAQHDPTMAVVLHSSINDVQGVMVDGKLRKWDGKLLDVNLGDSGKGPLEGYKVPQTGSLAWVDVARNVQSSRLEILKRWEGVDWKAAEDTIVSIFGFNAAGMI